MYMYSHTYRVYIYIHNLHLHIYADIYVFKSRPKNICIRIHTYIYDIHIFIKVQLTHLTIASPSCPPVTLAVAIGSGRVSFSGNESHLSSHLACGSRCALGFRKTEMTTGRGTWFLVFWGYINGVFLVAKKKDLRIVNFGHVTWKFRHAHHPCRVPGLAWELGDEQFGGSKFSKSRCSCISALWFRLVGILLRGL